MAWWKQRPNPPKLGPEWAKLARRLNHDAVLRARARQKKHASRWRYRREQGFAQRKRAA